MRQLHIYLFFLLTSVSSTAFAEPEDGLSKVYVVLRDDSEAQLEAALSYAEVKLGVSDLKETSAAKFEIFGVGSGAKIFSAASPFADRLREFSREYPQLGLSVCSRSGKKLVEGAREIDCDRRLAEIKRESWFEFEVTEAEEE